jgi:hypothetical protein
MKATQIQLQIQTQRMWLNSLFEADAALTIAGIHQVFGRYGNCGQLPQRCWACWRRTSGTLLLLHWRHCSKRDLKVIVEEASQVGSGRCRKVRWVLAASKALAKEIHCPRLVPWLVGCLLACLLVCLLACLL